MSRFKTFLRGLCLAVPFAAITGIFLIGLHAQTSPANTPSGQISQQGMSDFEAYPNGSRVGVTKVPPVAMIVASTDEQLFYKAYTDYTPLDGGNTPDITYNNSFEYQGYFNPNVCYAYSSDVFEPVALATNHACGGQQSGQYSGNFMNWVTMSRLDMLRYAMYGGLRSLDTSSKTILSRAIIPNDGHAWVKVYTGSDLSSYIPNVTGNSVSLCNAYVGSLGGASDTSAGLHIARGTYTQWASMDGSQCTYTNNDANAPNSGSDYTVSVQVCDGTYDLRDMCKKYGSGNSVSIKPTGVLQQFGQSDSTEQIRFAMITGSRATPRTGGVLRKNAAFIEGNLDASGNVDHTCATSSNELRLSDGTFCTSNDNKGIIQNLSLISLNATNNSWSGSSWPQCSTYGIYNRYPGSSVNGILDDPGSSNRATEYHCGAWGNPVAEMYGEALRYMSGAASGATNGFDGNATDGLDMSQNLTWKPPVTNANYCAACAIVLISSGQVTFDGDEIPGLSSVLNEDVNTATDAIGDNENISGNSYIFGRALTASNDLAPGKSVNTTSDVCQAQTVDKFSLVRGICPDGASMEGSYLVSGEAWQAWVNGIKMTSVDTPSDYSKPVKTYAVALSESLPTFNIPTSSGTVTLAPLCQSSNSNPGRAPSETDVESTYRTCGLLALQLGQVTSQKSPNYVYGKPFDATQKSGSFIVVWDDSTWGNDHDLDVTSLVSWCVGGACGKPSDASDSSNICWNANLSGTKAATGTVATANSAVCSGGKLRNKIGDSQVVVRTEALTAVAGNDLSLGFSIAGASSGNGIHRTFYRPGNQNYNLITGQSNYPAGWTAPQVEVFTGGNSSAGTLQNPLWYAAKYGGFNYVAKGLGLAAATTDAMPTTAAQWQGKDGNPANYFLARNPSDLVAGLQGAFQEIADSGNSANNFGNATTPSSSNDVVGNGLSYQVQYFAQQLGVNWTGSLQSFWSDSNGFQREGTLSGVTEVENPDADYVVSGPDTSSGALANAKANYRCSVAPVPAADGTAFDPSANGSCAIVSSTNPLKPVWDARTLLDAYYDPTAAAGTADAKAIANLAVQRSYVADASAASNTGQRYIFTYLTNTPDGAAGTGTVTTGTQTAFIWNSAWTNPSSCPTTNVTLSATSGFWGCYNATKKVRSGNYSLLNEKDPALAQKLVNWVRGVEYPDDYRSRTNSVATVAAGKQTYRLGDIVDSSPTIVGTPAESYDLLYGDFSYAAFRANYSNRRQMVYVGANDGMLHAFNGGFYGTSQLTDGTVVPTDYRQLPAGQTTGDASVTQGNDWALGQEAWAFVPDNLLPHLRWLADKNYTHVFYVDGTPVVTDAQVFTSSTITGLSADCKAGKPATDDIDAKGHVCGWGTVMVVPFRLGGGPIDVDTVGNGAVADAQTSNSAYVVLDVTDPEQPPTVLGEITTGTFTTSEPAFSVHREQDGKLHFLLTLGSGPADNGGTTGTKPVSAPAGGHLTVSVYDLSNLAANETATTPAAVTPVATLSTGPANSFAGDMIASDFNLNDSSEGVYFGVVTNPVVPNPAPTLTPAYTGGLWKLDMDTGPATTSGSAANPADTSDPNTWTLSEVSDAGQPVTIRPTVAVDSAGRPMIYFGTGRSFTTDDDSGSTLQGTQQQYIYGISDNSLLTGFGANCATAGTLFDATNVNVVSDGSGGGTVSGLPRTGFSGVSTLSSLQSVLTTIDPTTQCYAYSGWKLALSAGSISGTTHVAKSTPSERVVSSQTLLGGILLTPTYVPPSAAQIAASGSSDCNPVPVPGTSNLYGMNYQTGTADPSLFDSFGGTSSGINRMISLGSGKASSPVLHTASDGTVTAAFGISGGTTIQQIGQLSGAKDGEISWREPVDNQ